MTSPVRPASSARRVPRWALVGGGLLVLGAVLWGVQAWRGPQVPAVVVQAQPLVRLLQFSARVETLSRVGVGSTVVGRVETVKVREGDSVQAGQTLVQLETRELQAAVQQAQAALAQARAQARNVRQTSRISAQAQVAQAQAGLTQAQADWERSERLVAQGFFSPASLDEKRKALQVAQAQLQAAQAQSQASGDDGAEWQGAQAQVQQAEAAAVAAQAKLAQAQVLSPRAGTVLQRSVEPGQIVQPGTALLQLALQGPLLIVAQVDERYLDQLRVGQAAVVVADAYAQQRLPARVQSIAPGVDAQRGAVEVKLALRDAPPAFLREDMTLSVSVETGREASALVLPLQALLPTAPQGSSTSAPEDGRQAQVLRLQGQRAVAQSVTLGLRTLEAVQVLAGLQAGDTVLLPPAEAGQRVRARVPVPPAAASAPPSP